MHFYSKYYDLDLPRISNYNRNGILVNIANKIPDECFFINPSFRKPKDIRKRLLKNHNREEKCAICGLENVWNGKFIQLQIDHIDGDSSNNELSNLRFLCPNCHSQTDTYGRKNRTRYNHCNCGTRIDKKSIKCTKCENEYRKKLENKNFKINWPEINELLERLKNTSFTQLGKELGVSDNAIRKHIKKNNN